MPATCPIAFLFDAGAERVGDLPVLLLGRVLVDQRSPGGAVAHPGHEVSEAGAGTRSQRVPGVPQVVEVEPGQSEPGDGGGPVAGPLEIGAAQYATVGAGKDQRVGFVAGVVAEVCADVAQNGGRPMRPCSSRHACLDGLRLEG